MLNVVDTGVGIPPEMLDGIFDLFVQGDDTLDRSEGGMGVGLSLVRSIVELHGGRSSVHSDGPGHGSEFSVRLPLTNKRPESARSEPPPFRTKAIKILIVEDNPDSREMLRQLLSLEGHTVLTASDGNAGVKQSLEGCPDVALIDIGLPGMDGYEVARRIRAHPDSQTICLVALTGYGQETDRQAAKQAGFDAHLVKPLQLQDFHRLLASWHDSNGACHDEAGKAGS